MTIAIIPDAFLIWLWKQFLRTSAACVALVITAFLLSIVFRVVASMIEALHEVLHQVALFCTSVNHAFATSGLFGQFLMCLILLSISLLIIVRGGHYLCKNWRIGK